MALDFVAVDVETANEDRGSICSLGWAIVRGGQLVEAMATLTKPPASVGKFADWNTRIHGITESDVSAAPRAIDVIEELSDRVSGQIFVAHNASFDFSAVNRVCQYESRPSPDWAFACSMVLARRKLDLISYRLPIVAQELGVPLLDHHNAAADAAAAAGIAIALARLQGVDSIEALAESLNVQIGSISSNGYRGSVVKHSGGGGTRSATYNPDANPDANPEHSLYGQVLVFTGNLTRYTRSEAKDAAALFGATSASAVTKKTTALIIGGGFKGNDPSEFSTGKAKRAVELRMQGQKIEVLTENDFLDLLDPDS